MEVFGWIPPSWKHIQRDFHNQEQPKSGSINDVSTVNDALSSSL